MELCPPRGNKTHETVTNDLSQEGRRAREGGVGGRAHRPPVNDHNTLVTWGSGFPRLDLPRKVLEVKSLGRRGVTVFGHRGAFQVVTMEILSLGHPEMKSSGPCGKWSHERWGRDQEAGPVAFCVGLRSCCPVTLSKLCSGSSPTRGLIQHVNRPRPVLDISVSIWSRRQAVPALCPLSLRQAACPSLCP